MPRTQPLRDVPRRILVAGTSGSGKTTLARRIGARLGIEVTDMDAIHWQPGWTSSPSFVADVEAVVAGEQWVSEWQYTAVRPLLAARADVIVWLDLPTWRVMWQLTRRTLRRRLRREPVCNGNYEPPLSTLFTDPDHIIRWGWRTRAKTGQLVRRATAANPGLSVVHVRSHRAAGAWLDALAEVSGPRSVGGWSAPDA